MDRAQLMKDKLDPQRLKDRFKTLLPNKKDSAPEQLSALAKNVTFTPEEMASLPAIVKSPTRESVTSVSSLTSDQEADPEEQKVDDEVLMEVEEQYYDDTFDPARHQLQVQRERFLFQKVNVFLTSSS